MSATPKQIELAEKLAKEQNTVIPDGTLDDFEATSEFISGLIEKAKSMPRPPSERQLSFARSLADEKNLELPGGAEEDWKICSAFIDEVKGS